MQSNATWTEHFIRFRQYL